MHQANAGWSLEIFKSFAGSEDSGGLGGPRGGGVLGPEHERYLADVGSWSFMLVCMKQLALQTVGVFEGAVSPPDGSVLIGGGNSVSTELQCKT